jgi:hypothetical protein
VVGDSKMDQWLPALELVAGQRGWRLVTYLKSACPFIRGTVARDGAPDAGCQAVNDVRVDAVLDDPSIDVVLDSQYSRKAWADGGGDPEQAMSRDLTEVWAELRQAGKQVVVLADNQAPPFDEIDCVATHRDRLTACAFPRKDQSWVPLRTAAESTGVPVLDMEPWICPQQTCPAVIGGVLVYRQTSHLSATYVRTMTRPLMAELDAVVDPGRP